MTGDITRDSLYPAKHFSRVLAQQGRVTLDAGQNEQVSILLHYLRTVTRDLIGPYPGPTVFPKVLKIQNYGDGIRLRLEISFWRAEQYPFGYQPGGEVR